MIILHGQITQSFWNTLQEDAKDAPFAVTPDYAWGLFLQQSCCCAFSGEKVLLYNCRLDRVDPNQGYVPGNVRWVKYNATPIADIDRSNVIPSLKKHILVDGLDILLDLRQSFGSWLVDRRDNRRYLDFFSQFASQALGWNHPSLVAQTDKLAEVALTKVAHSDIYTDQYNMFVQTLIRTLPEFTTLFFIAGGTLAVENALKIAFDWKAQKSKISEDEINILDIVHFENSFHGRSGYSLSLTNTDPNKIKRFPKFPWTRLKINDDGLQALEGRLKANCVAAVIIEPIQGEGGDVHVPQSFLQELRTLTNRYESLLIFDEVQTGFSTGKPWCYQHYNIVPDLLAFGKKIQVCGVAATKRIYEVQNNALNTSSRINSTWGADIVDLVRSTIILDIIENEKLLERSAATGEYFVSKLKELGLKNVRGRGTMVAFDHENRDDLVRKLNEKLLCLKCGSNSIRFRPHLTAGKEEVDTAIKIIKEML